MKNLTPSDTYDSSFAVDAADRETFLAPFGSCDRARDPSSDPRDPFVAAVVGAPFGASYVAGVNRTHRGHFGGACAEIYFFQTSPT